MIPPLSNGASSRNLITIFFPISVYNLNLTLALGISFTYSCCPKFVPSLLSNERGGHLGGSRGKYVRNAILDIHINLSYRLKLSKKHFALMKRKLNMKLGAMLPKKFGQMDLYCPLTVLAFILLRRSRELTTPPPTSEKGRRKVCLESSRIRLHCRSRSSSVGYTSPFSL